MKRLFSLLLAAIFMLVLLLPVSGAVSMSFIAVNDSVPLSLTGDQRPFSSGGVLYVPYSVFSAPSLGFYPSYSAADKTLALLSTGRDKLLLFDLAGGIVMDETQNIQSVTTISKAGTVFLPAAFCAGHFGVRVSDLTSVGGYQIVRFATGSEVYDDWLLVEKAENLIAARIAQATTPSTPPTTPSTPVTPTTPTEPGDPERPQQESAQVCLAVIGGEALAQSLQTLERYQQKATFFLTAQELANHGDLVRRLVAEGHYIGLRATESMDAAGQLADADLALDRAIQSRSLLALLPAGAGDDQLAQRYRIFPQPATRLTATEAAGAHGQTRLLICDGDNLATSLQVLTAADCQFLPLRETTLLD